MSSTPTQSSSHHLPQNPSQTQPPPPYLARRDTILPPSSDKWERIPAIITQASRGVQPFLLGEFLDTPNWFPAIEKNASSIDIVRTLISQNAHRHWSLRFLLYAPYLDVDSEFVGEILCELIYTVFTPDPSGWPGGIETIKKLTKRSSDTITRWFNSRQHTRNTRFDVPGDRQWQEVFYDNIDVKLPIRTSAYRYLDHIRQHNGYTLSTKTFHYCVTEELGNLVMMFSQSWQLPPMSRIFANLAYKAVYVGPYDFWSDDPLEDLREIEKHSEKYNPLRRPQNVILPMFYDVPRNRLSKYRAFRLPDEDHVEAYVSHGMSDGPIKFTKEVLKERSRHRPPTTVKVRVKIWLRHFIPQHHADDFFPRLSF